MPKQLNAFGYALKFIRPKILTTCYLIVLLGALSAGSISYKTVFTIAVLVAWYIHAASSNDYADLEIDEVNLYGAKDRPLVSKKLSGGTLWVIHFSAGIIALMLSAVFGIPAILLTVTILAFDYMYSFKPFRITDRGFIAQLMLPIAYVIYPFSLGYWSVQAEVSYPWILVVGLYCGFIARLFLKDFRDIKGDSKFGKRTFLIRHGRSKTCIASWSFGFVSLILLSQAINFSIGALIILILGHIGVISLLLKLAKTSDIKKQVKLIEIIAKIANISILAVLLYYFCNIYLSSHLVRVILPVIIGLMMMYVIWRKYSSGSQDKHA